MTALLYRLKPAAYITLLLLLGIIGLTVGTVIGHAISNFAIGLIQGG